MKNTTLNKYLALIVTFFCALTFGYGQTTLVKEDIAIIGVNTDNEDFTFLLRTDIATGTQIYFSDNEVNVAGTGLLDTNEGIVLFTANTDYSCGTVISYISNSAEFTNFFGVFALNNNGDEILAFQGYTAPNWTTFLHANVDDTITFPVGFTAADIIDGAQENREYAGSKLNLSWANLNTLTNYNEGNNFSAITLDTTVFNCCPSSTTWDGTTWDNGIPNTNTAAIINADYIIGNSANEVSFSACSLVIDPAFKLTINNGDYVQVENDVIVDGGTIKVETQGAFVQNGIGVAAGSFSLQNGGTAELSKTTRNYSDDGLHYTYWSSPVVGSDIVTVFANPDGNRRYYFEASNYLDEHTVGTTNNTPDDFDDTPDDWQVATGIMSSGTGYAVTASPPPPVPNPFPYNDNANFSGVFNTGDIDVTIYRNDTVDSDSNWNLVGNPYPSAISSSDFFDENTTTKGILEGVIYLWTHNSVASGANPGNDVLNFSQDDYAIINFVGGTGQAAPSGGQTPNDYIPSGQGFFVIYTNGSATTSGAFPIFSNDITFTNAMRMADGTSNSQFFRSSSSNKSKKQTSSTKNRIWMELTSDNGVFSQILIGYMDSATNGDDGLSFDAPRNKSSNPPSILYTNIENNSNKFAIQGKAESSLNEDEVISLGFKTTIDVATIYTLSIAQLEGDFLSNNAIYVKDNLLNTLHNLKTSDYNFTSEVGEFNERFEIVFNSEALSTDEHLIKNKALSIIEQQSGDVQFKLSGSLEMQSIQIIDLQGRVLYNLIASGSSKTYSLSNLSQAPYVAKVTLADGYVITKKAIKRY